MHSSGLIVLAAGEASRMGQPKQLLDFAGQPMVRHAASEALASGASAVVIVCGAHASEVRSALTGLPVTVVFNPAWAEGMGTSIQCGLNELARHDVEGAILALADQPLIGRDHYRRLVEAHQASTRPVVASRYAGTFGVPAWFSREVFPDLFGLGPNQGCKGVIQARIQQAELVDCPDALADVDTPKAYEEVLAVHSRRMAQKTA